jgi:phosphoribosylcarboxyaminoimidazole (NCAIR) mutase
MGSHSDWDIMQHSVTTLAELGVPHESAGGIGTSHARFTFFVC